MSIDLYSGIGGWTLGLKMAGIEIQKSFEWWPEATKTHNNNFGLSHEPVNIRELVNDQGEVVKKNLLPDIGKASFVVGSPPCTQFSFSNRGGSGDIEEGLIDIKAFLAIVDYLRPKAWAMENVPRVEGILKHEVFSENGVLRTYRHLFNNDINTIRTYNSADFGVPQRRKRMIAGNFDHELLNSYIDMIEEVTLGEVIDGFNKSKTVIKDPNYNVELHVEDLLDHIEEEPLNKEEERLNHDSKSFHPIYNKMSFPEKNDSPSRTVTALCTRVSRESIIVKGSKGYRRLTVRERAALQSFPLTYQFYGKSYGSNLKMIGNAVPPVLTYYIANALRGIKNPKLHNNLTDIHATPTIKPSEHKPPTKGSKFSTKRRFVAAIPNLRFGSGMRFELSNKSFISDGGSWKVDFYYGSSSNILQKELDETCLETLERQLKNQNLFKYRERVYQLLSEVSNDDLQSAWIHKKDSAHPHDIIDGLGDIAIELINDLIEKEFDFEDLISTELNSESNKLSKYSSHIVAGMIIGSFFNQSMNTKQELAN